MPEKTLSYVKTGAIVLAVVFGLIYLLHWHQDVVRNAVADYAKKQEEITRNAIQKVQDDADAKYKKDRADQVSKYEQAKTPDQMSQVLTALLGLSKPPTVITLPQAPVATQAVGEKIPNAPSTTQQGVAITFEDYNKLYTSATSGDICKNTDLPKCQADKARAEESIASLQRQLIASDNARKGGTRKEKTVKALKVLFCAGGGAAAGAAVKGPVGAAIGSASSAAFCEITF